MTFTATPSAYRYALGVSADHAGRLVGGINLLAWGGVVLGASAYGTYAYVSNPGSSGANRLAVAGLVAGMLVGGGMAVLGTYLLGSPNAEAQEGAGSQWVPGASR